MQGRLMSIVAATAALIALAVAGTAAGGAIDPADLSVTKSDDPDPVAADAVLTYTITVENLGPDPATAVTLEDDLPGGVDFVSATASTGTCERQGNRVQCALGDLASGAQATVTIQVRPKKGGQLSNTATAESTVADPQQANNTDTEQTTVTEPPKPPAGPTCGGRPATILGTPGDDSLVGDASKNVIRAFAGNDVARGRGGNDAICLNVGNDRGRGGGGNDLVKGGAGADRLRGGLGADVLRGGAGNDICRGGPGRDVKRSC